MQRRKIAQCGAHNVILNVRAYYLTEVRKTVASLRLVSLGAATDGNTLSPKKVMTFQSHRPQNVNF